MAKMGLHRFCSNAVQMNMLLQPCIGMTAFVKMRLQQMRVLQFNNRAETRVNGAGDHLKDAVGVCAHELADPQLAIFLARLLEPKQGALLSHLLANDLLPRKHASHVCSSMAVCERGCLPLSRPATLILND